MMPRSAIAAIKRYGSAARIPGLDALNGQVRVVVLGGGKKHARMHVRQEQPCSPPLVT